MKRERGWCFETGTKLKEEGRRKKEEGRRKKEEGRRKKEEGRRKEEEGEIREMRQWRGRGRTTRNTHRRGRLDRIKGVY